MYQMIAHDANKIDHSWHVLSVGDRTGRVSNLARCKLIIKRGKVDIPISNKTLNSIQSYSLLTSFELDRFEEGTGSRGNHVVQAPPVVVKTYKLYIHTIQISMMEIIFRKIMDRPCKHLRASENLDQEIKSEVS